jgi:NADH dehydrogenase
MASADPGSTAVLPAEQNARMATVTVFGGTGFLGSEIVRELSARGYAVRIATRHPLPQSPAEGATHVTADVRDEPSVRRAVDGAFAIVNAVSLYAEKQGLTFGEVHVDGARNVARCARDAGAERVVHVSGLGSDPRSPSAYVRARAHGEKAVREAFPDAVVLQPSVMFGRNDSFLSAIEMATRFPVVPLFGRGDTRLQPVYVADVADAAATVIADSQTPPRELELGGAETLTYREIVAAVAAHLGRRRWLVQLPFAAWKALAAGASLLPSPPLTRNQVILMETDNVVTGRTATFADLGIRPASLRAKLPECLPRRS